MMETVEQISASKWFEVCLSISVAKSAMGLSSQHSSDGVEHKKGFSLSTDPPIVMWQPSIQASQDQVTTPTTLIDTEHPRTNHGINPMTIEFQGNKQCSSI